MYPSIQFVIGVVTSILATVICSLAGLGNQRRRERLPFASLLNFTKTERVVFVFPARQDSVERRGLLQNVGVAFEDMLAVNYMQRALTLAGWSPETFDMREHPRFRVHDAHDPAKNVVLICSPRSNPVTGEFIEKIKEGTKFDWTFLTKNAQELEIGTGEHGKWSSATYEQEKSIRSSQGKVEDGPLDDVAMIVKASNPYNPVAKVLIIAGIRGIGTWGAAKFLREHAKKITQRAKGENFAMLVKVKYRNWGIELTEEAGVFRTF